MTNNDFPRLIETLKQGMTAGLHIGAAVHIRHNREKVADFALGAASLLPYRPLRPDHMMLWLSAGKPVTALAIGLLRDRSKLSFDSPVCDFIPEFKSHGKDRILIRHLLTHTQAYRPPPVDWPRMTRKEVINSICDAELIDGEQPGKYAAYDPQTGWYVLSEIVERISGIPNHEFVKEELLEKIGIDGASIGLAKADWTAARDSDRLAVLHDTDVSARARTDLSDHASLNSSENEQSALPRPWVGDDALRSMAHNPAGGVLGSVDELASFYQLLLNMVHGDSTVGDSLGLTVETVANMTSRQRVGMKDRSFGQIIDWGYGFLINSAKYGARANPYGYGKHASDETFGHGGMQSSSGFADPKNNLAAAIIFNGMPGEPKHQKRINDTITALYEDLGITR